MGINMGQTNTPTKPDEDRPKTYVFTQRMVYVDYYAVEASSLEIAKEMVKDREVIPECRDSWSVGHVVFERIQEDE